MIQQTMAGPAPAQAAAGGHTVTVPRADTDEERAKAKAEAEKQIQELQRQAPALVDYTLYFEDWRDADGIRFPFRIRRAAAGSTTEEWTVSKIKINPKIDAKKFAVDSGS
jgi:hypothetical protein